MFAFQKWLLFCASYMQIGSRASVKVSSSGIKEGSNMSNADAFLRNLLNDAEYKCNSHAFKN
jgi:hypothetical protein